MEEERVREGMSPSIRCQFCGDFGEKAEPYICPLCKEKINQAGYVQLDPDQNLPLSGPYSLREAEIVRQARKDMLKAGFVKVLPKKE